MKSLLVIWLTILGVVAASRAVEETKQAKKETADQAVNGLKLSLSTNKTEMIFSKGGKIEKPAKLKLTFTNVSDKAIKFNAFDFNFSRIKGDVKAVPADSMESALAAADRKPITPKAGDFFEIKPGETWSYSQRLEFPGFIPVGGNKFAHHKVVKAGEFRVQFTYNSSKEIDSPFAKGIWIGQLVSNEIVITVKAANDISGKK